MYFLGIDTSCYTTSLAAADENGELVFDGRKILEVPMGGRGLRQSDAVFQHVNNLGKLSEECFNALAQDKVAAVAVSSQPRKAENSYMPVFTVGINTGKIISAAKGLPYFETSHQENHILAGLWSAGADYSGDFLAYHVSGGTTELLYVRNPHDMEIEIVGGSRDLKAGQFIDRVGVSLGLGFPCGWEMDSLCRGVEIPEKKVPLSIEDCYTSFSGPESHIQRLVKENKVEKGSICMSTFLCIAQAIEKTAINACRKYNVKDLLLVGGVTANTVIREFLDSSLIFRRNGIRAVFSDARYSADNAVGTALYGRKRFLNLEV